MQKIFLTILCLWALGAGAVGVKSGSAMTLVDSCGFFPQLSLDGQWLLYSPTDAKSLMLKNLSTGQVTTVANTGYPGVYYITQQRKSNGLVYRTGHCYDPSTGKSQVVLKPQHGRVEALQAVAGVVVNGERQYYRSNDRVGAYVYTRGSLLYLVEPVGQVVARRH